MTMYIRTRKDENWAIRHTSTRQGRREIAAVFAFIIGLSVLLALAGCSQFQTRGDAATGIDQQALLAPVIIQQVSAGQLDGNAVQAMLATNADTMGHWSGTATTNWFAYAFGGKLIFTNQDYVEDLAKASIKFNAAQRIAATQPALGGVFLTREETDFLKFKAAKDGKKSP